MILSCVYLTACQFLLQVSLIAVILCIDRSAHQSLHVPNNVLHNLVYMLVPQFAVYIQGSSCFVVLSACKSREVLSAVACVYVRYTVPYDLYAVRVLWRCGEQCISGCYMLQLVVSGEQRRCHRMSDLFEFLRVNQSCFVAIPLLRSWHDLKCIFLMPGSARVDDSSSTVADVLQFHVNSLCPLPFRM